MAGETTGSQVMNGGDGHHSYTRNSTGQRSAVEEAKFLLQEAVLNNVDLIKLCSSPKAFLIADLGCSTGPNTIIAVENIIEAVKLLKKQSNVTPPQSEDEKDLEFQVFFNDHVSNDFNTLFKSFPSNKQYSVAGVPGAFQNRLFPKSSINFFHISASLHWLLSTPKALIDENSPAYNKGRIYYNNSDSEVCKAYSSHYATEIDSFFRARAEEIVPGGMIIIIILCRPENICASKCSFFLTTNAFESCLLEMAKSGIVSEDKIDSFNLPMYFPTREELATLIKKNGCFSIETLEEYHPLKTGTTVEEAEQWASHARAAYEGLFKTNFGDEIASQLFDMFAKKYVDPSCLHHYRT